jgi:hypothetical protein
MDIECGSFTFVSSFDSGNLARVELVPKKQNGKMFYLMWLMCTVQFTFQSCFWSLSAPFWLGSIYKF